MINKIPMVSRVCQEDLNGPNRGGSYKVLVNRSVALLLGYRTLTKDINYRIYPCISRPFMASKEAPKIALDLYTGQRFRAMFQLSNLFEINIIMLSCIGHNERSGQKTSK